MVLQTISDNELRLRQIDSDIERLNKQLAYLQRVRVQYAALVEAGEARVLYVMLKTKSSPASVKY